MIECTHGGAKLQPHGPVFTTLELSPRINPRLSVFVRAIARELLHIRAAETPDGTPAVPYIVFLVRPDGIAPYYLARTCLEPLGMAFGYELIEQKLEVNIPDFDDLTTWDGTVPLDMPLEPAPGSSPSRIARANQPGERQKTALADVPRAEQGSMKGASDGTGRGIGQSGQGAGSSGGTGPDDFVWPGRGRQASRDAQRSSDRGAGGNGSDTAAGGSGPLAGAELAGADPPGTGSGRGKRRSAAGTSDVPATGHFGGSTLEGQGTGDQSGASGNSITPGKVNGEDVVAGPGTETGTGAGTGSGTSADPADLPFPASGTGQGGAPARATHAPGSAMGGSATASGGKSAGADRILQLPNFEPAGDQAGRSPALGQQPGLLSGSPSRGASGAAERRGTRIRSRSVDQGLKSLGRR